MDVAQQLASLRDRNEELEQSLSAASDVNRHLAAAVERLTMENDSLTAHLSRLKKRLKPQLPAHHDGAGDGAADLEEPAPGEAQAALTEQWRRLWAEGRERGWLLESRQIELGPLVGEGTFGATYRGTWRGVLCAVKQVSVAEGAAEAFSREVSVLSQVRHPNVVSLFGAVVEPPERCWIVTEYLSGGTLAGWIYGRRGGWPPQHTLLQRLKVLLDVCCGMEALEQADPPILHRDLKPTNVLLDSSGRAKVSDLGLARVLTTDALISLTPETGTYYYMAPEVVRHELYATQADVWSWGCLAVETLAAERPYTNRHLTPIQVALQVSEGGLCPDIPANCPPALAEALLASFDYDPLNRPSFAILASVLRQAVAEEESKGAAAAAGAAGVAAAWQRWMKPKAAGPAPGGT